MHRKVLQGFANNFCQMFVGYKLYDDMENILMPLSQCTKVKLEIDVLTGECHTDGAILKGLTMPTEMRSWFAKCLLQYDIPVSAIKKAQLNVEYKASRLMVKVDRRDDLSIRERFSTFFGRKYSWD